MDLDSDFMNNARSAEDGALGSNGACADPQAASGDLFGPEGWVGYAERLPAEELLTDAQTIRVNWDGCEAAVGAFEV